MKPKYSIVAFLILMIALSINMALADTSYFYDFETYLEPYWADEWREPDAWYYYDYYGQGSGGWVEWSSDVSHSGEHSMMFKTSQYIDRHRMVLLTKYPYEDATNFVFEGGVYSPDMGSINVFEFSTDKLTGERRMSFGVQYLTPMEEGGLRWDGTEPRWRYWKGGPIGRFGRGDWLDIDGGEMQLASNIWHHVKLVGEYPLVGDADPNNDNAHISQYVSLEVDGKFFDLSQYKSGPMPIDEPSNTWQPHIRFALSFSDRPTFRTATIYYDDVSVAYEVEEDAKVPVEFLVAGAGVVAVIYYFATRRKRKSR